MRRMQKENFRAVKAKQENIINEVLEKCALDPVKYNVTISWPEFDKKTKQKEYQHPYLSKDGAGVCFVLDHKRIIEYDQMIWTSELNRNKLKPTLILE